MTNREALEQSLSCLGEVVGYEAEIQAALALADLIDAGDATPETFREYRFAVKAIREGLSDASGVDEDIKTLLARLGNPGLG